jgi:glycosyltransferase involved in cell wall biosynthesis
MERSDIYLMTSDNEEGWGAVVNEAMNAGCAVAASHAAGAVPYLIRHKENGLVFKSGDVRELTFFVKKLCTDRAYAAKLGRNAYRTINNTWNAKEAADRFLKTAEALSKGGSFLYDDGPLSPAPELTVAKTYKKLRETT